MTRAFVVFAGLLLASGQAWAVGACQDLVKSKQLPADFKVPTRSKFGPAELVILSSRKCTCNDTPAVRSSLGQTQPDGVFWACETADADDTKAK